MDATLTHTLLILAAESIVILLGICAAVVIVMLRKSSGDKQAATTLVNKLKKNEPRREESLREIFASNYHLEGDELDARVAEFLEREKAFYKMLIATYMQHDGKQFPKLSEALEDLIAPCIELTPAGLVDAGELATVTSDLDTLKEENDELAAELQANKDIVRELMKEYSAAFEKGTETDKPLPEAVAEIQGTEDTRTSPQTTAAENVEPEMAEEELDLDSLFTEEQATGQAMDDQGADTATDDGVADGDAGHDAAAGEADMAAEVDAGLDDDNEDSEDPDPPGEAADDLSTGAPATAETPAAPGADEDDAGDATRPAAAPGEAAGAVTTGAADDLDIDSLFDEAQQTARPDPGETGDEEDPATQRDTREPALDFDLSDEQTTRGKP